LGRVVGPAIDPDVKTEDVTDGLVVGARARREDERAQRRPQHAAVHARPLSVQWAMKLRVIDARSRTMMAMI
jgi:hypothetical protein